MRDIIHEDRDGEKLVSVIRRRGDRDRVRINSNPHPITPCRSAGDREDLEPEVDLECMNCEVVEWSEPSPEGERREPTICAKGKGENGASRRDPDRVNGKR